MSIGKNWVWFIAFDQSPLVEQAGIVASVLRIVHIAIKSMAPTMAPTMGDYERLPEVWAAIDDVESLRATPLVVAVLMNRTVTNSTSKFRELMSDEGHTVLSTTIPRREPIAQAFGGPVTEFGKYADAADEIETLVAGR